MAAARLSRLQKRILRWLAARSPADPWTDSCSGLQTVGDGLANSSISQPTIIANKQGSWLTIIANGPTLVCE
jgi:hypothetical protein